MVDFEQLYQTSIANIVQRVAPEIFCWPTYQEFEGAHPWSESLRQEYYSNPTENTDSTHDVCYVIICEHWSKNSEMQMDFPCFRRLVLSVFAIVLKSSSLKHAILSNFPIMFHICDDCSPLITSVVAYILNILADYHSFLPTNYNQDHNFWEFYLSVDRKDSSSYSIQNLVERHFLNFYVRDDTFWNELILMIPFPQTMQFNPSTENVLEERFTTGGKPRSRLFPKP